MKVVQDPLPFFLNCFLLRKGRLTSWDLILLHSQNSCRPSVDCGDAGIEPGTAALQSGSPSRLSQLSHHIPPTEPPHPRIRFPVQSYRYRLLRKEKEENSTTSVQDILINTVPVPAIPQSGGILDYRYRCLFERPINLTGHRIPYSNIAVREERVPVPVLKQPLRFLGQHAVF
jgi:hypothetical protein